MDHLSSIRAIIPQAIVIYVEYCNIIFCSHCICCHNRKLYDFYINVALGLVRVVFIIVIIPLCIR